VMAESLAGRFPIGKSAPERKNNGKVTLLLPDQLSILKPGLIGSNTDEKRVLIVRQ
jgi:hypothetical protein